MSTSYKAGSLTLIGTVAMGTGVMIGAGIFALIAFLIIKATDDPVVVIFAMVGVGLVFVFEYCYLKHCREEDTAGHDHA
jgi:hypothetical protein